MRLCALIAPLALSLAASAPMSLAQDAPVLSVTPVSFALAKEAVALRLPGPFDNDNPREVPFSLGEPARAGLEAAPGPRVQPRATQRVAERRAKKAFTIPWMGGVFQ
jgi:hypothetical protein